MKTIVTLSLALLTACVSHPTKNLAELKAKASIGDATGQFELAIALMKVGRSADAVTWFQRSAKNGHPEAQNNLGVLYQNGRGVTMNSQEAVRWYQKAADQGLGQAEHNLAWMYDQGLGIPEDDKKAVYWYRRAAKQGVQASQLNLGLMLAKGEGVPQNHIEAHKWLTATRMNSSDKHAQWTARQALCELETIMSEKEIKDAGYSYRSMPLSKCEPFMSK